MSRYDELRKKFGLDNPVTQEDETTKANNGRNLLAGAVNPLIQEYVNPILPEGVDLSIPEMTVADQKRYDEALPEQMAGAAMGTINTNPARFGKILQMGENASQNLGRVKVVPSAADHVADVQKVMSKPLKANEIATKLQEQYGTELAKRKDLVKQGLLSPDAYQSFKQEMTNKIRGQ